MRRASITSIIGSTAEMSPHYIIPPNLIPNECTLFEVENNNTRFKRVLKISDPLEEQTS
jgi:hypothetical protein